MDSAGVIRDGDVLVVGERIEAVGKNLEVPEGTIEIDASDGILMPGMIDTHRHMWQTTMRGYGGDWSLSQYFVFYYLSWGKLFRPEDIFAGNLLGAIEAIDSGVTTTLDWSHGLQTTDHAEAGLEALKAVPGRFVLGYGNLLGAPWEWATAPEFKAFVERHFSSANDMLGLQLAFDVTGQPEFPERAAFEVARDLDLAVTTHAGVWGATTDDGIRQMSEGGFMNPRVTYVHASTLSQDSYQRIAASGGNASVSAESEDSAGQGYPCSNELRRHGIPSRCRWTRACGGAPTPSRPCAPRSTRTAPATTSARMRATRRWSATTCARRMWCATPPLAAPTPSGSRTASAASPRARRPTSS